MKKLLVLFSHKLTAEQVRDATDNLNIEEIIYLPEELQKIWSNVNPYEDSKNSLQNIFNFIRTTLKQDDFALIQGEWGFVYDTINFCKSIDITPIYATTERIAKEITKENGVVEKISVFKHVKFKKY